MQLAGLFFFFLVWLIRNPEWQRFRHVGSNGVEIFRNWICWMHSDGLFSPSLSQLIRNPELGLFRHVGCKGTGTFRNFFQNHLSFYFRDWEWWMLFAGLYPLSSFFLTDLQSGIKSIWIEWWRHIPEFLECRLSGAGTLWDFDSG